MERERRCGDREALGATSRSAGNGLRVYCFGFANRFTGGFEDEEEEDEEEEEGEGRDGKVEEEEEAEEEKEGW